MRSWGDAAKDECEIWVEGQTPKIHPKTVTWKEAEKLQEQEGCEEEPEGVLGENIRLKTTCEMKKNEQQISALTSEKGEKMSTSSFSGGRKMM